MYTTYPDKGTVVNIRWMVRRDMPEVLSIEIESFEFPWTEDDFMCCLRKRDCIGMVAEAKRNEIVGFMVYELRKTTIHLINFAVHSNWRRQSIGNQMMEKLITKLSQQKRQEITTEIRETNLSAQLFFRKCGFKATRTLHRYYVETPEEVYVMQYRHKTCPDKTEKPNDFLPAKLINLPRFNPYYDH